MVPPIIMHFRINRFRLWLPFFIFWPFILLFFLLVLPITILIDILLLITKNRYHHVTKLVFSFYAILVAAKGITVKVKDNNSNVDITIF